MNEKDFIECWVVLTKRLEPFAFSFLLFTHFLHHVYGIGVKILWRTVSSYFSGKFSFQNFLFLELVFSWDFRKDCGTVELMRKIFQRGVHVVPCLSALVLEEYPCFPKHLHGDLAEQEPLDFHVGEGIAVLWCSVDTDSINKLQHLLGCVPLLLKNILI